MPTPAGREPLPQRPSGLALRRVALLAVVWAGVPGAPAMAAPCSGDDCENVARVLHSTEIAAHYMTIRIVDIGEPESAAPSAGTTGPTESMAPLLFLTPRVTSILEDVFNDSDALQLTADTGEDADHAVVGRVDELSAAPENDARPTSPVAGTEIRAGAAEPYGPLSLEGAPALPKFQRQMYRTDI